MGTRLRSGEGRDNKKPESLTPPTIEIHISEVLSLEPDRAVLTRFCGEGGVRQHPSGAVESFIAWPFCQCDHTRALEYRKEKRTEK